MASRAKKITELTALTTPSSDDLLVIVDAPSSNAVTKSITVGNLIGNVGINVTLSNTATLSTRNQINRRKETPAQSATSDVQGTWYFDDNYLYVATSNGTVKRVALTSF